jgi:hypothetical protein
MRSAAAVHDTKYFMVNCNWAISEAIAYRTRSRVSHGESIRDYDSTVCIDDFFTFLFEFCPQTEVHSVPATSTKRRNNPSTLTCH